MLRERGYDILPTHYGYVMQSTPLTERTFKVFHSPEQTADELNLIVSLGGSVVDVYVWHKVFGKICAELGIYTPQHVEDFMKNVRDGTSSELMSITGGHHYHTVRADSDKTLDKIAVALRERGYFVDEE